MSVRGFSGLLGFVTFSAIAPCIPSVAAEWARVIGVPSQEGAALAMVNARDGGYLLAGGTNAAAGRREDAWVVKLNATGSVVWQRAYAGRKYERFSSVSRGNGGGFVLAGSTSSYGAGRDDLLCVRVNRNGRILWQSCYGGSHSEHASCVRSTADGGYILVGETWSFGAGGADAWCLKLETKGQVVWQKAYGGPGDDSADDVLQTADGGYLFAGSRSGVLWLVRLDRLGSVIWEKSYNSGGGAKLCESAGGYLLVTSVPSPNAYVSRISILEIDYFGSVLWQKVVNDGVLTWGGPSLGAIVPSDDGGYVAAGERWFLWYPATTGGWFLKLDGSGAVVWHKLFGNYSGLPNHSGQSILRASDGGYVVAGYSTDWSGHGNAIAFHAALDGEYPGGCSYFGNSTSASEDYDATMSPVTSTVTITPVRAVNSALVVRVPDAASKDICTPTLAR